MWPPKKENIKKENIKKENFQKLKVAFVLRGGIAKIGSDFVNSPEDIYRTSQYIDYKACAKSIEKHIFKNNYDRCIFDTFIHSWNFDLQDEIVSIYKPRFYSFENNLKYKEEILSKITDTCEYARLSSALSIKKGIELMESYEDLYKFKYDLVIIYRPDLMLWKNMDLKLYIDKINKDKIIVNGHENENGDFHFIMDSKNARVFKNLYNSRESGNKAKAHFWIKYYIINYMRKDILKDSIMPGIHQEVARKLKEYSIKPNYIKVEKLILDYNYDLKLMD